MMGWLLLVMVLQKPVELQEKCHLSNENMLLIESFDNEYHKLCGRYIKIISAGRCQE